MSIKPRRIDFYPDNFIAGIAGKLEPEEIGIYWLICALIYSHGGAIENDPEALARLCSKTNRRSMKTIIAKLILKAKLVETEAKLMANGCQSQLKQARNRIQTARKNGSFGGRKPLVHNDSKKPGGSSDNNPPALSLSLPLPLSESKKESSPHLTPPHPNPRERIRRTNGHLTGD